jgi:hypothetical protein
VKNRRRCAREQALSRTPVVGRRRQPYVGVGQKDERKALALFRAKHQQVVGLVEHEEVAAGVGGGGDAIRFVRLNAGLFAVSSKQYP